jgi:hypothetical protein
MRADAVGARGNVSTGEDRTVGRERRVLSVEQGDYTEIQAKSEAAPRGRFPRFQLLWGGKSRRARLWTDTQKRDRETKDHEGLLDYSVQEQRPPSDTCAT